jgi:hypothetical protein
LEKLLAGFSVAWLLMLLLVGGAWAQDGCDRMNREKLASVVGGPLRVGVVSCPPDKGHGVSRDRGAQFRRYSACYRGIIKEFDAGCYGPAHRPSGEARLELEVRETLRGPARDSLTVWCLGVDIPGLITYGGNASFPQYLQFEKGKEVLVLCRTAKDQCLEVRRDGLFFLEGAGPHTLDADQLQEIRTLSRRLD